MRSNRPAGQAASGAITTPSSSASASRRSPAASRSQPPRRAATAFPTRFDGQDDRPRHAVQGAAGTDDARAASSRPSRVSRMKTRADSKPPPKKRKGARSEAEEPAPAPKAARLNVTTAAPPAEPQRNATGRELAVQASRRPIASTRSTAAAGPPLDRLRRPQEHQLPASAPASTSGTGSSNRTSGHSRSDPISTGSDQPSWSRRKPTPPQYRGRGDASTSAAHVLGLQPGEKEAPAAEAPPRFREAQRRAHTRILAPETPSNPPRAAAQADQERQDEWRPTTAARTRAHTTDLSSPRPTTAKRLGMGANGQTRRYGSTARCSRVRGALGAMRLVDPHVAEEGGAEDDPEAAAMQPSRPSVTGDQGAGPLDEGPMELADEQHSSRRPQQENGGSPKSTTQREAVRTADAAVPAAHPRAEDGISSEEPPSGSPAHAADHSSPSIAIASTSFNRRFIVTVERWKLGRNGARSDLDQEQENEEHQEDEDSVSSSIEAHDAAAQIDRVLSAADDEYRRQRDQEEQEVSNTADERQRRSVTEMDEGKLIPVQAKVYRCIPQQGLAVRTCTYRLRGVAPPSRDAVVRWMRRWGIGDEADGTDER
ncbi:hypothetical protein BDZ90DRAFT_257879 [Jaminaea rosea]|uniref:Uncharacterized protein n=1 Tax=Jaminaea rosea TaxID=1569628 RepID=A0A316V0Q6_9BASI|nr:hypothetical protein BDZ90DRAFT_257879 [Jaminaea rosea]PWN30824.1 hypothetical protein BDZ90DRAFT_257879 [Jaminaea rosea]